MCSLWVTMEHDEGDLQAVVRAGRGLACSSLSGRNPSVHNGNEVVHNQAYNSWEGVEPGSTCLAGLQGAAAAPDDGGSVPQMGFPNLLRASPSPRMDLQGLCAIPFYSGGILMRSAPANVDAPAFAPAPEEPLKVEKKLCHAEQEFGGSPADSAFAPAADSGLADVPGSKPPKVEGGDANANSPPAHPRPADGGMSAAPGPSPKNPGSKRRKTQQKRIVCVPAAGGSNRPSGEGLPSDLWAWRKYGQKPIKGSPYPRGYYRCSSSKGCSARKQVERSRTDPTMLVITYTSDHNHPWPTHRNALAGSTRQTNSSEKISSAVSQSQETTTATTTTTANNNTAESSEAMAAENLLNSSKIDSPAAGADNFNVREDDEEQAGGYPRHDDDFFADLGELPESLNILALRHFDEDKSDEEAAAGSMPMSSGTVADPFNLFNWSSSTFVDT